MDLNAVVIGCGRMGASASRRLINIVPEGWLPISHAECCIEAKGINLIGLSDLNSELLVEVGARYNIDTLSENYEKLLDNKRPDIICIATRTPSKSEIISSACKVGTKGIYVEKPLANSIAGCERVLNELANSSCLVSYGVNRRFHDCYRKAKEMVESGVVGHLKEVVIEFGASQLLWTHPHTMDLLIYYAGIPLKLRSDLLNSSLMLKDGHCIDSDPIIESAQFVFENNVRGTIITGDGSIVRLHCSEGIITIHGDGAFLQTSTRVHSNSPYFLKQSNYHPKSPVSATVVALQELAQAINGEMNMSDFENLVSPKDILTGTKMLVGCVWSHMNAGAWMELLEIPVELEITGKAGECYA